MQSIPPRALDEAECKLFTLLAVDQLGPSTNMQLLYFMFEHDIMNYFELYLTLPKLCSDGLMVRTPHPADYLYSLTDSGREMLSFYLQRLPRSKVQTIRAEAPAWRKRFEKEKELPVSITQNKSGEYIVRMQVVEQGVPVLTIELPSPELSIADKLSASWQENAGCIYTHIIKKLGGGA